LLFSNISKNIFIRFGPPDIPAIHHLAIATTITRAILAAIKTEIIVIEVIAANAVVTGTETGTETEIVTEIAIVIVIVTIVIESHVTAIETSARRRTDSSIGSFPTHFYDHTLRAHAKP
jgi:hypothetical protein